MPKDSTSTHRHKVEYHHDNHTFEELKKKDVTDIMDATVELVTSLSCPISSLELARRLMMSNIGSQRRYRGEKNTVTFYPELIKDLKRKYMKSLGEREVQIRKGEENTRERGVNAESERQANQTMQKVEQLFSKLKFVLKKHKIENSEKELPANACCNYIAFFSKLAGTKYSTSNDLPIERIRNEFLKNGKRDNTEKDMKECPTVDKKVDSNARSLRKHAQLYSSVFQSNELLRECVFALQGIEGEWISYNETTGNDFGASENFHKRMERMSAGVLVRPEILFQVTNNPPMMTDAIRICGECGWLYKRILNFIRVGGSNEGQNIATMPKSHSKVHNRNRGFHDGKGIVHRAFCAALEKELTEYHRLLAIFETQLPHSSSPRDLRAQSHEFNIKSTEGKSDADESSILTIRRLLVWLREPTRRLLALARLSDGVEFLCGGQLADAIHLHAISHGDLNVQKLLRNVVSSTTLPFYRMVKNWVEGGVLPSNYSHEFFIVEKKKNPSSSRALDNVPSLDYNSVKYGDDHYLTNGCTTDNVWNGKYEINLDMVPRFIGEELGYEIFMVGKGINFIRLSLDEPTWRLSLDSCEDKIGGEDISISYTSSSISQKTNKELVEKWHISFQYGNEDILYECLQFASQQVHSHILLSILGPKRHFMDHLLGLKRILLLGQGDFVLALLEGIHGELDKDASRLYIYKLNRIFDNSLRNTNARFLPSTVLDSFKVTLIAPLSQRLGEEYKNEMESKRDNVNERMGGRILNKPINGLPNHERDKGWDVFSLDYVSIEPINVIFHSNAITQYRQLFHLLWKLKHIEWCLNRSWKRATCFNHALWQMSGQHVTTKKSKSAVKSAAYLLQKAAMSRQTILHFVSNFQSYLMFEVLEGGWKKMVQAILSNEVQSLDGLLEVHDSYLNEIMCKSLLVRGGMNSCYYHLAHQLFEVIDECKTFCEWQDKTFRVASKTLNDAAKRRKEAQIRIESGLWGYDIDKEKGGGSNGDDDLKFLNSLSNSKDIEFVNKAARKIKEQLLKLLKMLNEKINTNNTSLLNRDEYSCSPGRDDSPSNLSFNDTTQFESADFPDYTMDNLINTAPNKKRNRNAWSTAASDCDDALRYLSFRLDFSNFYFSRKKR